MEFLQCPICLPLECIQTARQYTPHQDIQLQLAPVIKNGEERTIEENMTADGLLPIPSTVSKIAVQMKIIYFFKTDFKKRLLAVLNSDVNIIIFEDLKS